MGFLRMGLDCIFTASEESDVSVHASSPLLLPGVVLEGSHMSSECSLPSEASLNTVKIRLSQACFHLRPRGKAGSGS